LCSQDENEDDEKNGMLYRCELCGHMWHQKCFSEEFGYKLDTDIDPFACGDCAQVSPVFKKKQ